MTSIKATGKRDSRIVTLMFGVDNELPSMILIKDCEKYDPERLKKWESEIAELIMRPMRVGESTYRFPDPWHIEWVMRQFFFGDCELSFDGATDQLDDGSTELGVVY